MNNLQLSIEQATQALAAREPLFHRPESARSPADVAALVAPEFWEVGASGAKYSRAFVLETLATRHAAPMPETWTVTDFACQELAPNLYLATYQLDQAGRLSRRSTIWRHGDGGWQVVFHQGTLVAA